MLKKKLCKKILLLMISLLMILGTAVIGNASDDSEAEQKIWKYSFNPEVTAEGWIGAYSQVYDDTVGYGFDSANDWTAGIIRKSASENVYLNGAMVGVDTEDVDTLDAISYAVSEYKWDPEVNFYVNLPAGTYNIIVYAGGISRNETYDFNKIYINGEEIVRRYETDPWTTDVKSDRATLLTLEDIQWTKTVTLTETTKIEIKSFNPLVNNVTWFGQTMESAGGRAYLNAVVIEEVSENTDNTVEQNTNTTKYSFNPEVIAKGWIEAYSQVYDDDLGYGFDAVNDWSAGIIQKTESENAILNGAMIGLDTNDADTINAICRAVSECKGDTEVNFYVKLPAGTYKIIVYAGGISRNSTYDFNKIYINGEEIVRDFETDPWTTDSKSDRASLLTIEDIQWTKTITLTETTKVEIKSLNPALENVTWFNRLCSSAGGRAYLNGVVIEEIETADMDVYDGVVSFVNRMYNIILDREPDAGSETWINSLKDGTFTGAQVAEGFIMSEEFMNKDISNEEFVKIMYRAFFGREADAEGLATWKECLDKGYIKKYVFAGFANSNEFQILCDTYGITRGHINLTMAENTPNLTEQEFNIWQFVERLYSEVLGRTPDEEGMNTWAGVLISQEFSGTKVAEGFIMSDEFINKNIADEEFVRVMYRAFFNRDADSEGFATWINALNNGWTKKAVFAGFANSDEFGSLCEAYGIEQGNVLAE